MSLLNDDVLLNHLIHGFNACRSYIPKSPIIFCCSKGTFVTLKCLRGFEGGVAGEKKEEKKGKGRED
jgi:hypothetical protein